MTKQQVAPIGEWQDGQCRLVRAGDIEIAVFMVHGEYHAYHNFCPHAGAPLCRLRPGDVTPGDAEYDSGSQPLSVRCPWHGWVFDLKTGAFLDNPRCTLDSYRVEIADGLVWLWA